MDTTKPYLEEQMQRSVASKLAWLFGTARALIEGHTDYCANPTMLRPAKPATQLDRKGSALVVEKTSSRDNESYDIKTSGIAITSALAISTTLSEQLGPATITANDFAGKNTDIAHPNHIHVFQASYANGTRFFWTAELGNRVNIHCPTRLIFDQLAGALSPKQQGHVLLVH